MSSDLSTTSYALLGLLAFDDATLSGGLTGYELKQRADRTLRFYWVSPAMSQIYTALGKLHRHGRVETLENKPGRPTTRRYRITATGRAALDLWLTTSDVKFPVLKHPVALRLLLGRLMQPADIDAMLGAYVDALADRRNELQAVRNLLADDPEVRFPAMVADWGLAYYDAEAAIVADLRKRL